MRRNVSLLLAIGLVQAAQALILAGNADAACNSVAGGTSANISLVITRQMSLGTFTRPNTGIASIKLAADGTRTVPANLNIQKDARPNAANAPYAATAEISGGAGCAFKITTTISSGSLHWVTMQPATGYALSSTGSPAQGTLDAVGRFKFTIGVTSTVSDALSNSPVGGTISIQVTYI